MNTPLRPSSLLRPFLTLVAACFGLLLIPALASVGATGSLLTSRAAPSPVPAAAQLCDGRSCTELVEMEVRDVVPLESEHHAVVLVTKDREIVLPIFVDEGAAVAIAFRLAHRTAPHPQAQDLTDSMMTELGGELTEVRIDRVDDAVFSGRVLVSQGEKKLQLAARPSDSIALALAHGVKIFASRQVLSSAGISQADIDQLKKRMPHHLPPDEDQGLGGSGDSGREPEGGDEEASSTGRGETIRL